MVGGGQKKDNGLPAITSTNIFAALESRRRKKKSEKGKDKDAKGEAKKGEEPVQFWAPVPVTVKSWADVDDDDDDYYATTAPLPPTWAVSQQEQDEAQKEPLSQGEESEGDEEVEEEPEDEDVENEAAPVEVAPTESLLSAPPTPVVREPDRQLSKKELKKKELAELDAVLAELGLGKGEHVSLESVDENEVEPGGLEANGEIDRVENIPAESKSVKKKKTKREKSFKDGDVPLTPDAEASVKEEEAAVENGLHVLEDPKEVLKKIASMKKKKSGKDNDLAAKAAAAEASARAQKLAAAKKKEKHHYNQQPAR